MQDVKGVWTFYLCLTEKVVTYHRLFFLFIVSVLDDAFANDASHAGTTTGSSYISKDGTLIGTEDTTTDFVIADMENVFELTYSPGVITLTRTSPAVTPPETGVLTATDPGTPLNIGHLFVSAALNKLAQWDICGLGKYTSIQIKLYDEVDLV